MSKEKIGFIGLGAIGEPMCQHIIAAGYEVFSSANKSREAIERLKTKGLTECDTPAHVAKEVDVLMTMVWDEAQNDQILRGENGAIAQLKPGSVVIVMSTVTPNYCQDLAAECKSMGIGFLDCPVSGMVSGAEDGTLSMMTGGDEDTINKCRDVLSTMGTVMVCGPVGTGQAVKLGNNAISLATYQLIQEVRATVTAAGVDIDNFMNILNESTGRSFVSRNFPMPRKTMPLRSMPEKDMSRCLATADNFDVPMPTLQACYDAYKPE